MIAVYNENITMTQSRYDKFSHRGINGTDLGTNFILPFDCKVKRCGINKSGAVYLVLQSTKKWQSVCKLHNDYITLCFCHMPKNIWKNGTTLKKGNTIIMGGTGTNSKGVHLHLEIGLGILEGNSFVTGETHFAIKKRLNFENAFYLKKGKKVTYLLGASQYKMVIEREQMTYYAKIKYDLTGSRFDDGGYSWFYMKFTRTPGVYQDFHATKKDKTSNFKKNDEQISRAAGWNNKGWFMHAFKSTNEKTYYYAYIVKGK